MQIRPRDRATKRNTSGRVRLERLVTCRLQCSQKRTCSLPTIEQRRFDLRVTRDAIGRGVSEVSGVGEVLEPTILVIAQGVVIGSKFHMSDEASARIRLAFVLVTFLDVPLLFLVIPFAVRF